MKHLIEAVSNRTTGKYSKYGVTVTTKMDEFLKMMEDHPQVRKDILMKGDTNLQMGSGNLFICQGYKVIHIYFFPKNSETVYLFDFNQDNGKIRGAQKLEKTNGYNLEMRHLNSGLSYVTGMTFADVVKEFNEML